MKKYAYLIVPLTTDPRIDAGRELDNYGTDGWRVVGVVPAYVSAEGFTISPQVIMEAIPTRDEP